ncbi:ABC transporter ATP-binding protein [Vibrio fluvialis]|jgi:ABC-type polysaccharide/polyol phosphate transport system ATPase subunit|nr:ABC transporter ATP-binding protein [Vibrio fluvialis]
MSSNIAIQVKELTKSYQIYANPKHRLLQMLFRGKRQYYKDFSALSNVSFEVVKGDSVGILGHNGAGKSTLLQLLTGTLAATSGTIKTNGRIAALLELGAGFNPEFTGKENVYMNATILGLSKKEIDDRYDDILKFADIGEFIHRPVKTYSSGMYVRLAFSVAVHIEPEILIIDEALAVGDIRFQMKCLKHMEKLKNQGTTILFVSHSPEQVKRFCNKAIWLDKGIIKESGTSSAVCDQYKDYMSRGEKQENEQELISRPSNNLSLPIRITSTSLDKRELQPTESLTLTIEYEVFDEVIPGLLVGAAIYSSGRDYIFGPNTSLEGINVPNEKGKHIICYKIPALPLLPGSFSFDVGVFTDKGLVTLDYLSMAEEFYVESDYISEGIMYIKHEWDVLS